MKDIKAVIGCNDVYDRGDILMRLNDGLNTFYQVNFTKRDMAIITPRGVAFIDTTGRLKICLEPDKEEIEYFCCDLYAALGLAINLYNGIKH